MLLLWLSMVSMIPFDMVRLDSNVAGDSGIGAIMMTSITTLERQLHFHYQVFLSPAGQ